MTDPIAIKVTDGIDDSIRQKLLNIASAALEGYNSVQKLNDQLASIDTSSVDKLTKSLAANESATTKANLSYLAQETALNKAIAAEDKAATAALQLSTAQGKAQAAADKLAAAHEAASESVNAFGETEAQVSARLASVASAGAALAKSQQSISITATEASNSEKTLASSTTNSGKAASDAANRYTNYMSALNTINKSGAQGINATSDALKESADSAGKASIANAGVTRELIVLGHEAITGNFSRIPGSMLVLAERVNGVGAAFTALGVALGPVGIVLTIIGVTLAAVAIAFEQADKANQKFVQGLNLTGNAAGLTVDSANEMAKAIADANNVSISSSKDAVNALALTGRFTQDEVQQLATATVNLSKITGQSTKEIVDSFTELSKSPLQYAENLAETTNIISPAILAQVQTLDKLGQKTEETRVIAKAMFDYFNGNGQSSLTGAAGLVDTLSVAFVNLGSRIKDVLRISSGGVTSTEQLDQYVSKLTTLTTLQHGLQNIGATGAANALQGSIDQTQNVIDDLQGEAQALRDKTAAQAASTAAEKLADQALKETANAFDGSKGNVQKMNDELDKFRSNMKALLDNPKTANIPEVQNLVDNTTQIEDSIRAKYAPRKTPTSASDSRAAILAKDTAEIQKQLIATDQLNDVRQVAQKLDQIDIQLATHTKDGKLAPLQALDTLEKQNITTLLQQEQAAKRTEAAQESIYANVAGPLRTLHDGEQAITNLLTNHTITAQQAAEAQRALGFAFDTATKPLFTFNREMQQQNDLLNSNLDANQRAAQAQVNSINNSLAPKGKSLSAGDADSVRTQVAAQQQLNQVTQQYDQIIAQNKGAYDALDVQQLAYNKALDAGRISVETYSNATTQLAIARANLRLKSGAGDQDDLALASVGKLLTGYNNVLDSLQKSFGDFFQTIDDGFANSIGKWLVEGGSLKDLFVSVAQQGIEALIASLVKLGVQYLLNAALGKSIQAASLATSVAASATAGVATAAAWAPAAALVSLASFGANSIPADAALVATTAISAGIALGGAVAGFAGGGYTGNGSIGSVAGVVHGKEFVMNATATAQNRATLEAMNAGQNVGGSGGGGSAPTIVIENHGTPQTYETKSVSRDEIRMIAKDVVANDTPNVVSGEFANPNSKSSKALKQHYQVTPAR